MHHPNTFNAKIYVYHVSNKNQKTKHFFVCACESMWVCRCMCAHGHACWCGSQRLNSDVVLGGTSYLLGDSLSLARSSLIRVDLLLASEPQGSPVSTPAVSGLLAHATTHSVFMRVWGNQIQLMVLTR